MEFSVLGYPRLGPRPKLGPLKPVAGSASGWMINDHPSPITIHQNQIIIHPCEETKSPPSSSITWRHPSPDVINHLTSSITWRHPPSSDVIIHHLTLSSIIWRYHPSSDVIIHHLTKSTFWPPRAAPPAPRCDDWGGGTRTISSWLFLVISKLFPCNAHSP